jgi:methylglutaconyl-CoA hydratase
MRHGEAMEAFLRGNRFPASRAAELGLISRAVPAEDLDAAVDEVVADLRLGGPEALGFAKSLVYQVPEMEQEEAFAWTAELSQRLFKGDEAAAGMRAFLKREKPPWAEDIN